MIAGKLPGRSKIKLLARNNMLEIAYDVCGKTVKQIARCKVFSKSIILTADMTSAGEEATRRAGAKVTGKKLLLFIRSRSFTKWDRTLKR